MKLGEAGWVQIQCVLLIEWKGRNCKYGQKNVQLYYWVQESRWEDFESFPTIQIKIKGGSSEREWKICRLLLVQNVWTLCMNHFATEQSIFWKSILKDLGARLSGETMTLRFEICEREKWIVGSLKFCGNFGGVEGYGERNMHLFWDVHRNGGGNYINYH